MRFLNVLCVFICVISLCLSFGLVTVSATVVEDPTVSSPEVGISDPTDSSQPDAASDPTDSASSDPGIMLAASSDSGLDTLASWEFTGTQLGTLTLYLSQDTNSSGLHIVGDQLINFNNSTVYFYSPDYPTYTFSASRFNPVQYRANTTGSQTTYLNASSVKVVQVDYSDYQSYILIGLVFVILIFLLWRCIFK